MLSKSLLSLAIAASLVGMSGCNISSTEDNINATPESQQAATETAVEVAGSTYAVFNPAKGVIPFGSDLIFADAPTTDGTSETNLAGTSSQSPVTEAIDDLDGGISTIASIDIPMHGSVDATSLVAGGNVFLVRLPNAASISEFGLILPTGLDATSVDPLDLASIGPFFATTKADGTAADDTGALPQSVAALNLFGLNDGSPTGGDGILAMQPAAADYAVSVISLDDGTDNTIRISPTKPLASGTKYIVVVTGSVKGSDGKDIIPAPNYASVRGTGPLVSAALAPIRSLLQGAELMASNIITSGGTNLAPMAKGIAYSFTHTTGDPDMVLKSMAYPGYWAATAVVGNNPVVAAGLIAQAVAGGKLLQAQADGLEALAVGNGLSADDAKIFAAANIVSGALTTDQDASEATSIAYENPRNRDTKLISAVTFSQAYTGNQIPLVALNASTAPLGGAKVLISQGAIELPQYTSTLTDVVNPVPFWQASTDVGIVLDVLAGKTGADIGTTPPSDKDGSKNVTYRYPFAKEQRKSVAPLLFIEPVGTAKVAGFTPLGGQQAASAAGDCARTGGKWPVIISQHGFTVDRSAALLMGTQLAQNTCSVVVAMDLPHHGIAPRSSDRNSVDIDNSLLALTVTYNADTAATAPFAAAVNTIVTGDNSSLLVGLAERHEGLYLDATNTTQAMTYSETKAGKSGDYYIRLDNFQRTRDNVRQGVMDLLNLNATLATIDIDGDGNPDLDTSNVSYVGHSLGAIVGTSFVAVNNDKTIQLASTAAGGTLPKIKSVVLATPGGGLTKLLENSVSISPKILAGLSVAANIQPGETSFESYMQVLQATVDSGDPMNFIGQLATGGSSATPTMIIEMIGGGTISAVDADSDLNADADADGNGDNVDSSFSDALLTAGVYPADTVVPNNTDSATLGSAKMPLAGTDGMISLLGSVEITAAGANQVQAYPLTKFNQGTHGTFSSADSVVTFTEMVTEAATFIGSAGAAITVANDTLLGTAP